ncbi:MAG: Antibiotic biosynthesis monooxygenase, partial [Acidobacteria bacterium]|nr:Antibiotic biosynthesis monooxygenase [Acidobacteriota bacterium]
MITVANRIYVKKEYGEAFEKVFRERAKLVDEMPGFVSNQVLRPVNDGDPYVVFTIWNSRQDFLNWVRSEAFIKGHAQSGT